MKYLVTGGLGVIGSLISRKLLDNGHRVTIVDAAEEPRNDWIAERLPSAEIIKCRVEDMGPAFIPRVASADAVIHCAAHTGIPHSLIDPSDDWRSNVESTRALLDTLRLHPKPTVVLSSIKPYRVIPADGFYRPQGLDEDTVLEPDEPYAASKAAQSMLCQAYGRSYGVPVVTFRCSNLYGPAPCHGPRHGWLTWFCISAAIGRPIEVQGTGDQSRDMLHADDVFMACMMGLEVAGRLKGEIFNLGGGYQKQVTVSKAAEMLRYATGVEIVKAPRRAMDDDHVFVSTDKFFKATGWHPIVDVEAGVGSVLEWALANKEQLKKLYGNVK